MRFHDRLPGPDRLYFLILHAAAQRTSMYSYMSACCCVVCCYIAFAAAAAACCCCSSSCAWWQDLFPWFTASDPSVLFLFIPTRCIFNVPLGSTVAFSASLFFPYISYIIGTGMRGTKAGVSPPRRSPPCSLYVFSS